MNTRELLRRIACPLAGIELAELQDLVAQLERGRRDYEARLAAVEARKDALFADGLGRADRRGQTARAGQIAALEEEAAQLAGLLRIAHKQRLLLDRLIWLRENLALIERWRQESPAAVPFDWQGLVQATAPLGDDEARLDQINDALALADRRLRMPEAGEQTADSLRQATGHAGSPSQPAPEPPAADQPPTAPRPEGSPAAGRQSDLLVVRVLDGATIELANGQRVRYIGVDAPLMRNALGKPDAGAWEARDANRALVAHKLVRLEADQLDADIDGALWRYVYVDDVMVNAELLRQGVVYHAGRYPNNRHAALLLAAEQDARRHRRGLWKNA